MLLIREPIFQKILRLECAYHAKEYNEKLNLDQYEFSNKLHHHFSVGARGEVGAKWECRQINKIWEEKRESANENDRERERRNKNVPLVGLKSYGISRNIYGAMTVCQIRSGISFF